MIEAVLLGTAQDGGVPQAGCDCTHCLAARADPTRREWVACLGLLDHAAGRGWLIDATPDFREQLHTLYGLAAGCELAGILLTHAHVGHYSGLIHLGREAWNTSGLPVYASPRMARFLRQHAPWSQLVDASNICLHLFTPGREVQLSPRLQVTPLAVPHRDEFSDTLAFVLRGPTRRLFYCPDIDGWDDWEHDLRSWVSGFDVALLDGTFFSSAELPGRDLEQIPHPLVTDTAERLVGTCCDVCLIHLNHSNPLYHAGRERSWLSTQQIRAGAFGDRWRLDG